ncbi:MAG: tRNA (adenosine(37)-N6)-threonylcarbamoyltransferase complex dimerization subunit type 1 TsaB [Lachnospiraceae bacterium]|nr:tRNA (adenosine(37)-N6)-threonylcarbamoyltransferase complex dimerization subunit type 1 TsaB [Lachnospiraceae bacterium]
MKIIALDSSGLVASVAIVEDDNLIAEYNVQYKKTHSQTILPMLDELKKMVELDLGTVDAVAISKGPGSFTGLRIGSATVKGLAQALDIPVIEVGTLEGLACNLYGSSSLICPLMDARRGQVYTGLYGFEKNDTGFKLVTHLSERAVSIEEIIDEAVIKGRETGQDVIFLGDGVPVFKNVIKEKMSGPYSFAPAHMNRQRAAAFAHLAMDYYKEGKAVSCFDHAPEYLRLSQAERERNEGKRNKGSAY